jgi:hypothetical protein
MHSKVSQLAECNAGANVGAAAGGITDDDAHRPRRKGLRPRNPRYGPERGTTRCQMQKISAAE